MISLPSVWLLFFAFARLTQAAISVSCVLCSVQGQYRTSPSRRFQILSIPPALQMSVEVATLEEIMIEKLLLEASYAG